MASSTTSAPLVRLDDLIYHVRKAALRSDQGYGIGRTALVKRWTIITPNIKAKMIINGVEIEFPNSNGINFDCSVIRNTLREAIDNDFIRIDSTLFGTQLMATEYYRYAPSSQLFNLIFTGELGIVFALKTNDGTKLPDRVDIEEEYALSEAQLYQRLSRGETIEMIKSQSDTTLSTYM